MDIGSLIKTFFDSPGIGGGVVLVVITAAIVIYILLTRWIIAGGRGRNP